MPVQAHKQALQMANTINKLAGMIDELTSQLAASTSHNESTQAMLQTIPELTNMTNELQQKLKSAYIHILARDSQD